LSKRACGGRTPSATMLKTRHIAAKHNCGGHKKMTHVKMYVVKDDHKKSRKDDKNVKHGSTHQRIRAQLTP